MLCPMRAPEVPTSAMSPAPAPQEPVLRVEGLGKCYGRRQALSDLSFAAHAGELVAAIGPHRAAETTLLSILGGDQAPSAGPGRRAAGERGGVPPQPAR